MTNTGLPPVLRWEDVAAPRGAIHIVHGMAEHPGRYARLAAALNAAGFVVWAHHQRGHGVNPLPGVRGHFADANGWQALLDEAWAVSSALAEAWPGLPLILFAHSMGSFVGQAVVAAHGTAYRAIVFSGTNGPIGADESRLLWLARVQRSLDRPAGRRPASFLQWIVFGRFNRPFGRKAPPNTWLSRDAGEVRKYNCDPLCNFALSHQAWVDLLEARIAQSTPEFYARFPPDLPIHIIAGTADPVGEMGAGVARLVSALESAGSRRVSLKTYEAARHELVNETNRDEVTADLIAWLHACSA